MTTCFALAVDLHVASSDMAHGQLQKKRFQVRHIRGSFASFQTTALILLFFAGRVSGQQPPELVPWLTDQKWHRDVDGPVLSLGSPGEFDDTHIFAPTVARENGKYLMWYCGSRGFAHDLSETRTRQTAVTKCGIRNRELIHGTYDMRKVWMDTLGH